MGIGRACGRIIDARVITGLVPVIPIARGAARHIIGMAGTGPAMTAERMG
ncbi:hypothetical protein J4G37_14955 [Microvirga sp. 3-52]|jgi:hypothetical protein|nr:hypothetical protein [Microvirga sp. 3-52]